MIAVSVLSIVSLSIALLTLGFSLGTYMSITGEIKRENIVTVGKMTECTKYLTDLSKTSYKGDEQRKALDGLIDAILADKRIAYRIYHTIETKEHNVAVFRELEAKRVAD